MAADDQIKHVAQILRQARTSGRELVVGAIDYQDLDETDPKTAVYINGGAPNGGGKTRMSAPVAFESGEYLVVQAKNRAGSDKTLDSTGSTSGVFILELLVRDKNTGAVFPRTITEADKSTDLFADDPVLTDAKFRDAYAFKVPDGERWQLFGRWQQNLRTTA